MTTNAPDYKTNGAERGAIAMHTLGYDSLALLLADLAEYAEDAGLTFAGATVAGQGIAAERRRQFWTAVGIDYTAPDALHT